MYIRNCLQACCKIPAMCMSSLCSHPSHASPGGWAAPTAPLPNAVPLNSPAAVSTCRHTLARPRMPFKMPMLYLPPTSPYPSHSCPHPSTRCAYLCEGHWSVLCPLPHTTTALSGPQKTVPPSYIPVSFALLLCHLQLCPLPHTTTALSGLQKTVPPSYSPVSFALLPCHCPPCHGFPNGSSPMRLKPGVVQLNFVRGDQLMLQQGGASLYLVWAGSVGKNVGKCGNNHGACCLQVLAWRMQLIRYMHTLLLCEPERLCHACINASITSVSTPPPPRPHKLDSASTPLAPP